MKLSLRRKKEAPKKKKSKFREWVDAIVFAVIAASLIRWLFFEPFTIPTPSMERSLMVGDFLFVSKLHYGPMTPKTPLQLPLTHQKIWFTEVPSYSPAIQLPRYRLPHFSSVKKGDAVVFHYPDEKEHPTDMRVHYIKRCIATAGDTLVIDQGTILINGELQEDRKGIQHQYLLYTKDNQKLSQTFIERFDLVPNADFQEIGSPMPNSRLYWIFLTEEAAQQIQGYPITAQLERQIMEETLPPPDSVEQNRFDPNQAFPDLKNTGLGDNGEQNNADAMAFYWNKDNFGPLWIPEEGVTIRLTPENISKYGYTIRYYEGHDPSTVELGRDFISIDGERITEYTFSQDYFWMMGDNRDNSLDSRFWGFVPDDHVVGKAAFVWLSIDHNANLAGKIRFNRMFRSVRKL
ncbi:MAG TPA: signal peptidase I [Cytophagales bacterium]|nr:signal peptidase I [Cytophagales bacterium]HAA19952.1 signal peptidase I [Cytophagales bacterium]HAP62621.1 signal peptidase I [Cytophagales bacterium]